MMLEFDKALMVILGGICIGFYKASATVPPCTENRTESCILNLATFISLDKPVFASESELDRLCREAEYGQRCSSDFLRSASCVNAEDSLLIPLQIGRSQAVSQMLCSTSGYVTDPTFRKLYLKHESCIEEHQRKIKECFASSSVMEEPELEIVRNSSKSTHEKHLAVCCSLIQYIECAENAIESRCGSESKSVVLRVLMKTAGKQLEDFCTSVDPDFPNSPKPCLHSSAPTVASIIIVYFVMFVFYVLF